MGTLLTPRFAPAALSSEGNNIFFDKQTDSYYCESDSTYIGTSQSIIILMTIDVHYDYNKLSIVGVAKWRAAGGLQWSNQQNGNLGSI